MKPVQNPLRKQASTGILVFIAVLSNESSVEPVHMRR